ncbi:putative methyltransferase [Nitrospina gracilis 3/211]|uniref:Putative methyltransferase n=1 Tax=Nitrospina gracilis (strain 3/211) TaxID=1266370 RepID=M1Z1J0_NITG3|nr:MULTISPECIES: 50S ribosomal protein L11 methyltransferase [Nitrospina]MCF8722443.1 SAM-dependent methyltransferase [Nitrospina sp. Nb-3]CCQ91868.1 putative methyltransferase [Nitrospina gracilis 3/211]
MIADVASFLLLALALLLAWVVLGPVFFGAPWHWTGQGALRRALDLADAQPGETLVDLGSGDGRVLITAARDYGLKGVGIEIDPVKVWVSRLWAKLSGVSDRVVIHWGNVADHPCKEADIVYLYLSHQAVDRLFPALFASLKPGARVVTQRFCLPGLRPDKIDCGGTLFLYTGRKGQNVDGYR